MADVPRKRAECRTSIEVRFTCSYQRPSSNAETAVIAHETEKHAVLRDTIHNIVSEHRRLNMPVNVPEQMHL